MRKLLSSSYVSNPSYFCMCNFFPAKSSFSHIYCVTKLYIQKCYAIDTVYLTGKKPVHSSPRGARARDFVNFLHACSPRGARVRLTVYPPLGDVAAASSRSCDRKSKFGLRHAIKLMELYCVTESEFWFSMIPPSKRIHNVPSFVLPNLTVILAEI
jgi:hypothetical protein